VDTPCGEPWRAHEANHCERWECRSCSEGFWSFLPVKGVYGHCCGRSLERTFLKGQGPAGHSVLWSSGAILRAAYRPRVHGPGKRCQGWPLNCPCAQVKMTPEPGSFTRRFGGRSTSKPLP
jgi:hypothetical protein